eukprot:358421-Chlamydomonas_euryale.AAC.12
MCTKGGGGVWPSGRGGINRQSRGRSRRAQRGGGVWPSGRGGIKRQSCNGGNRNGGEGCDDESSCGCSCDMSQTPALRWRSIQRPSTDKRIGAAHHLCACQAAPSQPQAQQATAAQALQRTVAGARDVAAAARVDHAVVALHWVGTGALLPAAAGEHAIPHAGVRVAAHTHTRKPGFSKVGSRRAQSHPERADFSSVESSRVQPHSKTALSCSCAGARIDTSARATRSRVCVCTDVVWLCYRWCACRLGKCGNACGDAVRAGTEHSAQGMEHRAQGTGHRAQRTAHRAQGTGHRAQGTGKNLGCLTARCGAAAGERTGLARGWEERRAEGRKCNTHSSGGNRMHARMVYMDAAAARSQSIVLACAATQKHVMRAPRRRHVGTMRVCHAGTAPAPCGHHACVPCGHRAGAMWAPCECAMRAPRRRHTGVVWRRLTPIGLL